MVRVMPVGPILLTILLVLIYFGLLERVLDRMRLSHRAALLLTSGMLVGSLVEIPLAPGLSINLGGGVLPLGLVLYLLITADQWYEPVRALVATAVVAGTVHMISQYFPPGEPTELNLFFLDAQYLYGLTAGAVGYLAGRSRRTAFCAGVLGVLVADVTHYVRHVLIEAQPMLTTRIGGGGFQDTAVVAGVLAVLLAELVGETREALASGAHPSPGDESGRG